MELIRRFNFNNVLVYADPPYLLKTRHAKQYRHEMTDEDHEELLAALTAHKGFVAISGYDSPLYNEHLKDWHKTEFSALNQLSEKRREILWTNYEPYRQYQLF